MDRITIKRLETLIHRLNTLTGENPEPYTRGEDGRWRANVGTYTLSRAYGGVQLERMHSEGGGVTAPLGIGHTSNRDLWERVHAMIRGIELGRELERRNRT